MSHTSRRRPDARRPDTGHWARWGNPAVAGLVGVTVVGSVLAVGSVHLPILLAGSAFALLAAATAVRVASGARERLLLSAPVLVLLFLAGYSFLQAMPMPAGLLGLIAPANADVWLRALLPLGESGPSWASLSLDPGASIVEGLKWLAYACLFAAASHVASRRGAVWGVSLVFASGVAAALTTVAHGLSGATKVYGIYQPRFPVASWHVGPLLNPNNLAGYLNLAAMCGLGLMLSAKAPAPRWLMALGLAVIVGVDVTSASRGGVLVLLLGILVLASIVTFQRWRKRAARETGGSTIPWLIVAAVGGGAMLSVLGANAEMWHELRDKNLTKLKMVQWVQPMVREHPWFGIGRGAFESVFPAYRTDPGNVIYAHAENFPAQWTSEWGLPVGVAAVASLAWLFRPSRLGVRRSAVVAGAWVGVLILALHNLLDLALEVPAVMFAAASVVGSLWGGSVGRPRHGREAPGSHPRANARRWKPLAVLAMGVLAIGLAARHGRNDVASDRRSIHARFNNGTGAKDADQRAALRSDLRAAIMRHPAEPYFPLMGALVAMVGNDANAIPWLSRAIERGRTNGRAHLLLAEVLAGRGHTGQALMELRFAVEREPALAFPAARGVRRWSRADHEVRTAIPEGLAGAAMLEALAAVQPPDAGPARRRFLAEALNRDPKSSSAHAAMASELLAELVLGERSTVCSGPQRVECSRSIQSHAQLLEAADPVSSAGARIRARLLRAEGNPGAAAQLLAERCRAVNDRAECLQSRLEAAAECTPPMELPVAIREYLAARCAVATDCAAAAGFVGDLEAARGHWGAAHTHYARATRDAPTEQRWLKLADAAGRIGAHAQAAEALEEVAKLRGGGDPTLLKRIEAERAAALGDVPR